MERGVERACLLSLSAWKKEGTPAFLVAGVPLLPDGCDSIPSNVGKARRSAYPPKGSYGNTFHLAWRNGLG